MVLSAKILAVCAFLRDTLAETEMATDIDINDWFDQGTVDDPM